ncbi:Eukaryotic translation initiation factor 5B-like [Oopsacas minuta]|uniref:Eukaryotic translation initiation factor 5B n=1 Tax=Oopsacas minuta TaxID=111878 RepID=A0AAV7JDN0_9METZ|nr:Eukaryotic translation initiation factor 5B-like [Oopsacas minuta]
MPITSYCQTDAKTEQISNPPTQKLTNEQETLPNPTQTETIESDSSISDTEASSYDIAKDRITKRRSEASENRSKDKLRSPILCVLGHVDTGKTKILDKIRHTSVQNGEAGGITQQIGTTFVPADVIRTQTLCLKEFSNKTEILLPGMLIIDTPGHESFRNLRSRGSSLCDIAILVVDIMHGLELQTIESINLLKKKKCKFIIALNKVDRLYDWRRNPHSSVKDNLKKQKRNTADHFNERLNEIKLQLNTESLNVALFWEKFNFDEYIPMVPTSAITGDGMGDLMAMMVLMSQKFLIHQLMWSREVEATVMEVKVTPGYGHTLDVVLKNGVIKEGDTIVLFGTDGPIVSQARAILTPQPLKEMRVKGEFIHHQMIDNSQGIKLAGKDLENAIASSPVLIPVKPDEIPVLVNEINSEMQAALTDFKLKDKGVYVQASTLGSMEALLEFLKTSKIPYSGINIGPVHRKDVIRCSTMLEHDPQYAVILAFDVRIDKDALELADQLGIKIFTADIIYHLFDNFIKHRKDYADKMKNENRHLAVYPVRLSIVPNCVFNSRDPLVMGVRVEEGVLMTGTPIHVPSKQLDIGILTSIEINHRAVEKTRKGVEVCVKIETPPGDAPKMFERHFGYEDELVSKQPIPISTIQIFF